MENTVTTANQILTNAAGHLQDRATTYDKPQGERSMGKTVALFNTLTGHQLSEVDGWQFMQLLKLVRSRQGAFKADNFEDAAAYAALAGEAAEAEHIAKQSTVVSITTAMKTAVEKANAHDRRNRKAARNRTTKTVQAAPRKRGAR